MLKKYKTSIVLSVLVLSLVIFGKGINGGGLDIINNLGLAIVYSLPIFLIERISRSLTGGKITLLLKVIVNSLWVAALSTFLWFLAFDFLFYHPQPWENGFAMGIMQLFGFIYVWPIFFIGDIVLFLLMVGLKKIPSKIEFGALILIGSVIFLVYGFWLMAKCDFAGCKNPTYRAQQALKSNNFSRCKMTGFTNPNDVIYLLVPTYRFYDNQEECYKLLAIVTNDIKICGFLTNLKFERDSCYEMIAANLSDVSICDKYLTRDFQKGDCYSGIAVKNKDFSICENAGLARDDCYFETAYNLKDVSFCHEISFDLGRKNCVENINDSSHYTPMRVGSPE